MSNTTTPQDYYVSAYSGEEHDEAVGKALGAVRYDAAQTLTAAQQHTAQKNIGTTWPCNPNLLDNWCFLPGCVVNQRGQTSYTITSPIMYTIDRWSGNYVSVTPTTTGLELEKSGDVEFFRQIIDPNLLAVLAGKTVTLSVLTTSTLEKITVTLPSDVYAAWDTDQLIIDELSCDIYGHTNGNKVFRFYSSKNKTWTIVAVKLELGDQQTLAHQDADGNWVLNEIPNYAEQLARCQRYLKPVVLDTWGDVDIRAQYSKAISKFKITIDMRQALMRATPAMVILASDATRALRVVAYNEAGELISPLYVTSNQIAIAAGVSSEACADIWIDNPFSVSEFSEVSVDAYEITSKIFLSAEL